MQTHGTPLVLKDPTPVAFLEQFGASSLDLVLFAFLAEMSTRTRTMSDLYTAIDKRFAAAGIDIPNPQFDLNLHGEGDSSRAAAARGAHLAPGEPLGG